MKEINKSSILDRIKQKYHLKNNAALARFLGISSSTLANWYSRNSLDYDLILSKCEGIDINWLISGISNSFSFESTQLQEYDNKTQKQEIEHAKNFVPKEQVAKFIDMNKRALGCTQLCSLILENSPMLNKIDREYEDIFSMIERIYNILEHYHSVNKASELYDKFKENKINIKEFAKFYKNEILQKKELLNVISPVKDILYSLNEAVFDYDMKHDKKFDYSFLFDSNENW